MSIQFSISPPLAKKTETTFNNYGDTRFDPYHWLRDRNNPDTVPYLTQWNSYTLAKMKPLDPLIETLYKEIIGRTSAVSDSVPYQVGQHLYYHRTELTHENPTYYQRKINDELEEKIFEGSETGFKPTKIQPSPNGKYIALTDSKTIRIKDMQTGKLLDESIVNSNGQIVWNGTSSGFFFVQHDSEKLLLHMVGEPSEMDIIIQEEKENNFELEIEKDKLDRYLIVTSYNKVASEITLYPLNDVFPKGKIVHSRMQEVKNFIEIAINENIYSDLHKIQHERSALEVEIFKDYLAILKKEKGLKKVEVWNLITQEKHEVAMPQQIGSIRLSHNEEYDTDFLRFKFESPVTPLSTYQYNMKDRSLNLLKRNDAGGFDPTAYVSEQIWAKADDNTLVPISVYHKKGLAKDGSTPFLLYVFGAYGNQSEPRFNNETASLLERGIGYAVAHVRGGGELGKQWHESGRLMNKLNSIKDYIACAQHLINMKYTSPDRLAFRGRSAGGVSVGAAINLRPDLCKVCVAEVPFVDYVTTMFDVDFPSTDESEWKEWGNPENSIEIYKRMLEVSPYDNVKMQAYPSLFVLGAFNDEAVGYHEPAKWVAKLLEYKTDSNPLLFMTHMEADHHGPPLKADKIVEKARVYAFVINQLMPNQ